MSATVSVAHWPGIIRLSHQYHLSFFHVSKGLWGQIGVGRTARRIDVRAVPQHMTRKRKWRMHMMGHLQFPPPPAGASTSTLPTWPLRSLPGSELPPVRGWQEQLVMVRATFLILSGIWIAGFPALEDSVLWKPLGKGFVGSVLRTELCVNSFTLILGRPFSKLQPFSDCSS